MKTALLVLVAALVLAGGGFLVGILVRGKEPDTAAVALANAATARQERRADSLERVARGVADSARAETRRRLAADVALALVKRRADSLARSVRLLGDSLVVIVDSLGREAPPVGIPPEVGRLLEARRVTIDSQAVALDGWRRVALRWERAYLADSTALVASRAARDTLKASSALQVNLAYAQGRKRGRREGVAGVLAVEAAAGGAIIGLARAARSRVVLPEIRVPLARIRF